MDPWLIYGAYGYTGRLAAELAVARGLRPVLGGRDRARTEKVAAELGLEARVFALDDATAIDRGLAGMAAVLHAAGPFVHTYEAMAGGCLRAGCHYLDITGEIPVFEGLHALDDRARECGVVLLPGVGFDVVPTDCAAATVAAALTDPVSLELAFHARGSISRGTLKTAIEGLGGPSAVRRNGEIVPAPLGSPRRTIPFADRPRDAVAIPWGDVSTAYHSTGIPNVTVYQTGLAGRLEHLQRFGAVLRRSAVRRLLTWWVDRTVVGPDEHERARGGIRVWAAATDAAEATVTAELLCPDGYAFTADSAVTAVVALLEAEPAAGLGFLTPSLAFGPDFVDRMQGVEWVVRP